MRKSKMLIALSIMFAFFSWVDIDSATDAAILICWAIFTAAYPLCVAIEEKK